MIDLTGNRWIGWMWILFALSNVALFGVYDDAESVLSIEMIEPAIWGLLGVAGLIGGALYLMKRAVGARLLASLSRIFGLYCLAAILLRAAFVFLDPGEIYMEILLVEGSIAVIMIGIGVFFFWVARRLDVVLVSFHEESE
ncbi:MAG: hypothetical protein HUJ31_01005 [Pseudomonadales bacterium]|nr:hypothetical protein [Pseudomonadales bacterium]